jgi:hypothetical protein
MDKLNDPAIIMLILLISIFIPFVYLLVKLWIEQWKIQFKDND